MTLCEPTKQHFLLLPQLYSHRTGQSVCHNHTSVCSKTWTAPIAAPCRPYSRKQPAFCWVQFLHNGTAEASLTPLTSIHSAVERKKQYTLHNTLPNVKSPQPHENEVCPFILNRYSFPCDRANTQWWCVTEAGKGWRGVGAVMYYGLHMLYLRDCWLTFESARPGSLISTCKALGFTQFNPILWTQKSFSAGSVEHES